MEAAVFDLSVYVGWTVLRGDIMSRKKGKKKSRQKRKRRKGEREREREE